MQQRSSSSVRVFYPKLKQAEIVQKIRKNLTALSEKLPVKKIILFGSYAKGNYTIASDIDLFILYEGAKREDAYALSKKILAIPGLEPHVYSEAEYEEMKDTIERMTKDGIVIFPE
jgi:predicted nucleotidyltransferase